MDFLISFYIWLQSFMCKFKKIVTAIWPEYLKTWDFFSAIKRISVFVIKKKIFFSSSRLPHIISTYGYQAWCAKSEKLLERSLATMYLKTCHFEVFAANAAIFSVFWLFVIKQIFFFKQQTCRLRHIILNMDTELHVQNKKKLLEQFCLNTY